MTGRKLQNRTEQGVPKIGYHEIFGVSNVLRETIISLVHNNKDTLSY